MNIMDVPCTSAVTALAAILLTIIYYIVKNRNVLPGPKGLPYLGLYPFLKNETTHLQLAEYKKEYGDLFSFTYTGKLFINMGSVKVMRELHLNNSDCFVDRFQDFSILTSLFGKSLTMVNGESWKMHRKFFIQRFKDRSFNAVRDDMAGPVYDSLIATIQDLNALGGKPVNVVNMLAQRCSVTMRRLIFGEEGTSVEELLNICSTYNDALEGMMGMNMLLMGPLARLLFTIHPKFRKSLQKHQDVTKLLVSCVKRIERSMSDGHSSCIIEDYYQERNKRQRNNDPTWKIFTDEFLVESIMQFVGDGITGLAAFISGFLNTLLQHPEEQDKLYAELMEVVGPNRQPVLEDKVNLPYAKAFMNEVLREAAFFHMFPSLECNKETTIRGYRIPKGSITLQNFYSAHHDPDTYEDPDTFKPSRFMPAPGKPKVEAPVTFGIGKRSCSGEPFVMNQIFLFLTTIVKNFKIVSSNECSDSTLNFLLSGQLQMIFTPRAEK